MPRLGWLGRGLSPVPVPSIPSGYPGATPAGSQEQVTSLGSQEDMANTHLAPPQQRKRTASELLTSRWGQGHVGTAGQGWGDGRGGSSSPASRRKVRVSELEESERFYRSHNRFLKLVLAGYRAVTARSELLCYFIIILNNMVTASLISLFLPILMFLWAMLSIPRPTKRFWMTAIVFTEVGRGWPAKGRCHPAPAATR